MSTRDGSIGCSGTTRGPKRPDRIGRSLIVACLTLGPALGITLPARAEDELRLGEKVVPTFEAIRLVVDSDKPTYTGSVHVALLVKQRTDRFRFHAEEMHIDKISLRRSGAKSGPSLDLDTESGQIGLVTASTKSPLEPGAYRLDIEFSNDFGTQGVGLYRMEVEGRGYVFSQFEAYDAREAFPCWDEPAFKIPYQVTMVVPKSHLAVSNTPVESQSVQGGLKVVVFRKTRPLPSYLLAMCAGPLEAVDIPGMSVPGRVITVQGQKHLAGLAAQFAPPLLAALERWFDRKYPYEKLDLIACPEYAYGAMENPGAITFVSNLLLHDPKSTSTASRRNLAIVEAHEMAHMWFGDLVTMRWWDDLWLNESFADWMADKIANQVYPEYKIALGQMAPILDVMEGDAQPSAEAIHQHVKPTDSAFENLGTQYNKGKAVLAMFERWVGPEAFRRGVLDHIAAHAWGNATSDDLWRTLSKTSSRDLAGAMATFLDQPGLPLVSVELRPDGRVVLGQKRFLNAGVQARDQLWRIPVTLKYSDGKTIRTSTVLLSEAEQTVSLSSDGPIAWIIPDTDASGYYRWSIPAPMLAQLAADGAKSLSARERFGLVGNLGALLDNGTIHADDYLRVIGQFASEPEPMVLLSVTGALAKVKDAFVVDDLADAFAVYVRGTLRPALDRIGMDKKSGEGEDVSLVRPNLMTWLGKDGRDAGVRARALELGRAYVADPTRVDPTLVNVGLRLSALQGDRALWDDYQQRFEKATVPVERSRYLSALSQFQDPALIERNLDYALHGPLHAQEVLQLTGGLYETSSGRDRQYRWLTENYAAIMARIPPPAATYLPYMASGCESQRLEAARAFFSDSAHAVAGTAASLAKVSDQVKDCIDLRAREGAAVRAYLNKLLAQP